jgi:hypothetical protein
MDWKTTVLIAAAALGLIVAFLGRYEMVAVPAGGEGIHGIAYRLDRWTGEVTFMQGSTGGRVEIK